MMQETTRKSLSGVEALEAEVLPLFLRQLRPLLYGSLLVFIINTVIFWQVSSQTQVAIWGGAMLLLFVVRFIHARRFPKQGLLETHIGRWKRSFSLLSGISGLLWGLSVILLPVGGDVYLIYLAIMLLGMVAGANASLSLIYPAYVGFAVGCIVPLALYVAMLEHPVYSVLAVSFLMFLAAMLVIGRNTHRSYFQSLQLRYQNLELIEQLQIEKERAEASNQDKSRFLAAASHDLRQPLQALSLFMHSLGSHLNGEKAHHLHAKADSALGALHGMFDVLLDISRLDAGVVSVNHQDFDLRAMLNALRDEFEGQAKDKSLVLAIDAPAVIAHTDPILFQRVLRNLLSNAITHTSVGRVWLSLELEGHEHLIRICDTGPGIAKHQQELIFSEYYQVGNRQRDRTQGLGLGLAIVRRLCKLLDLPLSLNSTLGEGSCFEVRVPNGLEAAPSCAGQAQVACGDEPSHSLRILVVDDDEEVREALQALLLDWGYEVKTVASAAAAMASIEADWQPQLVISDYRLSGERNGIDVLNALRERVCSDLPALLITGDTAAERIQEAHQSGFPLLHKPVRPAALRAAINRVDSPTV